MIDAAKRGVQLCLNRAGASAVVNERNLAEVVAALELLLILPGLYFLAV
jgi:hypothetical protein